MNVYECPKCGETLQWAARTFDYGEVVGFAAMCPKCNTKVAVCLCPECHTKVERAVRRLAE